MFLLLLPFSFSTVNDLNLPNLREGIILTNAGHAFSFGRARETGGTTSAHATFDRRRLAAVLSERYRRFTFARILCRLAEYPSRYITYQLNDGWWPEAFDAACRDVLIRDNQPCDEL